MRIQRARWLPSWRGLPCLHAPGPRALRDRHAQAPYLAKIGPRLSRGKSPGLPLCFRASPVGMYGSPGSSRTSVRLLLPPRRPVWTHVEPVTRFRGTPDSTRDAPWGVDCGLYARTALRQRSTVTVELPPGHPGVSCEHIRPAPHCAAPEGATAASERRLCTDRGSGKGENSTRRRKGPGGTLPADRWLVGVRVPRGGRAAAPEPHSSCPG